MAKKTTSSTKFFKKSKKGPMGKTAHLAVTMPDAWDIRRAAEKKWEKENKGMELIPWSGAMHDEIILHQRLMNDGGSTIECVNAKGDAMLEWDNNDEGFDGDIFVMFEKCQPHIKGSFGFGLSGKETKAQLKNLKERLAAQAKVVDKMAKADRLYLALPKKKADHRLVKLTKQDFGKKFEIFFHDREPVIGILTDDGCGLNPNDCVFLYVERTHELVRAYQSELNRYND